MLVFTSLVLLVLAGLLGPLLAAGKRFRVPVLVGELVGGVILGRTWLHLIDPGAQPFPVFASLGFAMLMFESGAAIDLGSKVVRHTAVRAGLAFVTTMVVAIPAGFLIGAWTGSPHAALFSVLLAGSSAAVALPNNSACPRACWPRLSWVSPPPLRSGWPPGYCARQSRPPWSPVVCSP
jgi:Kef-type K+ transport system membrane component KefB